MATLDLKLTLDDETRLLSLPAATAPTWTDFASEVQQRFALDSQPLAATYVDNDGDEITLSSDAELAELFASSAGETSLSLTIVVGSEARPPKPPGPPRRSPETVALLDSVRQAVEKDNTLAHDLRHIVHDVLGPPPPPPCNPLHLHGHHHHGHHKHGGPPFPGRGGRGGFHLGPGRWEVRDRRRRFEQDDSASSSASDSETDSATEKQRSPPVEGEDRGERCGRKGFKHHHHSHFGPPPFYPAHHGAFPPPPAPGAFSPFGFLPPLPPFSHDHHPKHSHKHNHKHGKKGRKHGFEHHPPPPPPPHFAPGDGPFPFPSHPFFHGNGHPSFFEAGQGFAEGHKHGHGHHHHHF